MITADIHLLLHLSVFISQQSCWFTDGEECCCRVFSGSLALAFVLNSCLIEPLLSFEAQYCSTANEFVSMLIAQQRTLAVETRLIKFLPQLLLLFLCEEQYMHAL